MPGCISKSRPPGIAALECMQGMFIYRGLEIIPESEM